MNFFLYINRNFIILIGACIVLFFCIIIVYKQITIGSVDLKTSKLNLSNADIYEPKFAINNESKKIFITANEGNFLNRNEILLQDNVRFKSNEFSIETNKVIFNRNKQTAKSDSKSLFTSKNTKISSDGFDIYDKGNKIIFYGKSVIILKWNLYYK